MRGPSRGQESHAVRGPGAAPAGGARLLRRIPRGGRGRHSQPARPRQPVPERRLPSGDRLPGHAIFAFLRAPTGMQWLRRAVHPHAERAIPVGAHVSERGRVAAWAGGISRALQSALDRPALGLPHASPGSPAASCTWSRCMNTLSSVSKKSGAKQVHPWLLYPPDCVLLDLVMPKFSGFARPQAFHKSDHSHFSPALSAAEALSSGFFHTDFLEGVPAKARRYNTGWRPALTS